MSETKPQTYANHARLDPLYHFFLAPVFLITLIASIVHLVRHPHLGSAWHVVLALAFLILLFKVRTYPLKVQDRVIRLEERMRMERLLPEDLKARIGEFRCAQLVGLRFASDAELPGLARKVLDEKIEGSKTIKQMVQNWRADYLRA